MAEVYLLWWTCTVVYQPSNYLSILYLHFCMCKQTSSQQMLSSLLSEPTSSLAADVRSYNWTRSWIPSKARYVILTYQSHTTNSRSMPSVVSLPGLSGALCQTAGPPFTVWWGAHKQTTFWGMIPHPLNSNIALCISIRKYLHKSDTSIDKTDHCKEKNGCAHAWWCRAEG